MELMNVLDTFHELVPKIPNEIVRDVVLMKSRDGGHESIRFRILVKDKEFITTMIDFSADERRRKPKHMFDNHLTVRIRGHLYDMRKHLIKEGLIEDARD